MNNPFDTSNTEPSSDEGKPNQETGIHLHAASGAVSVQAQSGKLSAAADKKVTIASTNGNVSASANTSLLATALGAFLRLEGGNIELQAPGKIEFKASQKILTGPLSVENAEQAFKVGELNLKRDLEVRYVDADGQPATGEPVSFNFNDGGKKQVALDGEGKATLENAPLGPLSGKQPTRRS